MHEPDLTRTVAETVGAIFYALVGLHGEGAEYEAAQFLRAALERGCIRDPYSKEILSGIVRCAEPKPAPPRYSVDGNIVRLIPA
jgi:hypothetical protein